MIGDVDDDDDLLIRFDVIEEVQFDERRCDVIGLGIYDGEAAHMTISFSLRAATKLATRLNELLAKAEETT